MSKPRRQPTHRSQDRSHKRKRCIDCVAEGLENRRKAPHPGPRCATHWRAKSVQRKNSTWAQRLQSVYNLTEDEYWEIYEFQGGRCFICRFATGKRKRLSVDHDHETGYVRGLLCTFCNRLLGHARDTVEYFERCIEYLKNPPAFQVIGKRKVPD